jgi:hypothetical protein
MFGVLHDTISTEKLLFTVLACLNIANIELYVSSLAIAFLIVRGCPVVED